jgi:uncharacterized protein
MLFNRDDADSPTRIQSYEPTRLKVQDEWHTDTVILTPEGIIKPTPITTVTQLTPEKLAEIFVTTQPEILLIGEGDAWQMLPPQLQLFCFEKKVGVEVMSLASACRTFNILLAEWRKVMGLFILKKSLVIAQ